jgi:hypothetical protein
MKLVLGECYGRGESIGGVEEGYYGQDESDGDSETREIGGGWGILADMTHHICLTFLSFFSMDFRIGRRTYRPYITTYAVALTTIFDLIFLLFVFHFIFPFPMFKNTSTCRNGK